MASIEFSLFAPYNEEAALIGDFSDWQPVPMEKGDDGTFRASVELKDGEYRYKFRVRSKSWFLEPDSWVEIVDPYATRVEDSAMPSGIARIKDGRIIVDEYVWQHDDAPLPPDEALVIYEMHIGDFSGGEADGSGDGSYRSVVEKLDYLSDLGVGAIELMPVTEYPGERGWGYNPRYFMAAESSYGGTEDLKRLIDSCHARGIRVITDLVFNHADAEMPLTQIDHDYWFHHQPRDPENNWGPEFNYEHYDEALGSYPARRFAGDVIRFWVREYHIDGIRFDAARQLANYDFIRWAVAEAKAAAGPKPFYTVAEHIPETTEITGPSGPVDGIWHESFYNTVNALLRGEAPELGEVEEVLDARRQGFPGVTNVVNYLANHDHDHLLRALGEAGILGQEAFRRARLGAVLLMTAFGVPLVWMGQEFGEYGYKTAEENKLEWTLLAHDDNRGLHRLYQGLIRLRAQNGALQQGNIELFHEDPEARVLAYVRWNDEGSRVVVVANLSEHALGAYEVPNVPADGVWHEWTRDYDLEVSGGVATLELGPFEAQVLVI